MFDNIAVLRTSGLMARHAASHQRLVSENIANSNTPGYAPQNIESFSEFLLRGGPSTMNDGSGRFFASDVSGAAAGFNESKPNGNSVSVEGEALKSIEIERQHSAALAIYQHSMDLLKVSIGRG